MHLATHLMLGWTVANIKQIEKRDRGLITLAGVIPDVDSLGLLAGLMSGNKDWAFQWHMDYHHVLTHNLFFAILISIASLLLAKRRYLTSLLVFFSFHLHILGDLVGSRGPDGYQWPISYFYPFLDSYQLTWSGQWQLNAWPNILLTAVLLFWTIYLAWRRGYSPVEFVSTSADRKFVEALRKRFGQPEYEKRKAEGARAGGD